MPEYFVYIMASHTKTLYTGISSDLVKRVFQHKNKITQGFTSRYNVERLVYYEGTSDVIAAIEREKRIKSWTRAKKVALIESTNPTWRDLSFGWYEESESDQSRGFESSGRSSG